jgi:hypothetical protein
MSPTRLGVMASMARLLVLCALAARKEGLRSSSASIDASLRASSLSVDPPPCVNVRAS